MQTPYGMTFGLVCTKSLVALTQGFDFLQYKNTSHGNIEPYCRFSQVIASGDLLDLTG